MPIRELFDNERQKKQFEISFIPLSTPSSFNFVKSNSPLPEKPLFHLLRHFGKHFFNIAQIAIHPKNHDLSQTN